MNTALVLNHLRLADAVARRTWERGGRRLDLDDLTGEARLALLGAAEKYDPSRGVKFSSFATNFIGWRLAEARFTGLMTTLRYSSFARHRKAVAQAFVQWSDHWKPKWGWGDRHGVEDRDQVENAFRVLRPRERLVMRLIYFEDMTQAEVSRALGCTASWISLMHEDCLARMRERLEATPGEEVGKIPSPNLR